MTYKNVVNHLHVSAFCDHLQGRIQQRKMQVASCVFLYFLFDIYLPEDD